VRHLRRLERLQLTSARTNGRNREELPMSKPRDGGHKIIVTVSRDGIASVHGISLLDDLWEDYEFFRKKAQATGPDKDLWLYKRYARASLLAFFGFLDGVLNDWMMRIESTPNRDASFNAKLDIVVKESQIKPDRQMIQKIRELRCNISHPGPTDDQAAMHIALIRPDLFDQTKRIAEWLEKVSKKLELAIRPEIGKLVHKFAESLGRKSHRPG
jgi:hypothetical protein